MRALVWLKMSALVNHNTKPNIIPINSVSMLHYCMGTKMVSFCFSLRYYVSELKEKKKETKSAGLFSLQFKAYELFDERKHLCGNIISLSRSCFSF